MVKSEGLIRRVTTIATGLLLAALLAVLVLLWGERPAEAAFPGANGKIVFAGRVMRTPYEGQDEIFKMNPDGSNATRLTHNTGHDYDPAWSSDGQKIAFVSDFAIYVMDIDPSTNDAINITNNRRTDDYGPDWSPSGGRKIAFKRSGLADDEI